ncbi:GerAB/ArcD/ProY family transporter [Paenibacillus sp. JNUCC32]|uniref:GerAB/ArcD/ProY family transporter n=1 Tax=Paenibacillus sp. JNUCC32 TaxID=2777984 RepID=UPI00178866C6|nr:GerAB/ArcD/ProY family transporter [Paenibacillus sp. JNUCC-32]QOT10595.1 GerAB/ArcD/ProY family transporter [Paenibacillus sp. JNUCC-32]
MRNTPWQLFRFGFVYLNAIPTGFLVTPLLWNSAYLGWAAILGGYAMSLVFLWFMMKLGLWDPRKPWINFGSALVSKWIHFPIVALVFFWSINYIGMDIEGFTLFFDTNYMRESPQWFILLIVGLVVMVTARWGMETMIYISDGLFLVIVVAIVAMNMFFFKEAHWDMMIAMVRHHNYESAIKDSLFCLSFFAEWIVFLFLAPYIQFNKKSFRNLAAAGLLVTIGVMLQWASALLNFGPYLGREMQYPLVELMRAASGFLGNSDPLIIGLWSSSMFFHSAFLIHVSVRCMAKLLNLKQMDGPLIAIIGGTAIVIAYQYSQNPILFQQDFNSFGMAVFFILMEFIPIFYWIASLFRKRKRKPKSRPKPDQKTA